MMQHQPDMILYFQYPYFCSAKENDAGSRSLALEVVFLYL